VSIVVRKNERKAVTPQHESHLGDPQGIPFPNSTAIFPFLVIFTKAIYFADARR